MTRKAIAIKDLLQTKIKVTKNLNLASHHSMKVRTKINFKTTIELSSKEKRVKNAIEMLTLMNKVPKKMFSLLMFR